MDAKRKAEGILSSLDYDFGKFTLPGFIEHIQRITQRQIHTIPFDMPATLFGAWISDADEPNEFIFFRKDSPPIHQVHIQLHELAHFLCGHPTLRVRQQDLAELLSTNGRDLFSGVVQLRSNQVTDIETEAETVANLIQEHAIRSSRLDQLINYHSSFDEIARSLESLGLA